MWNTTRKTDDGETGLSQYNELYFAPDEANIDDI